MRSVRLAQEEQSQFIQGCMVVAGESVVKQGELLLQLPGQVNFSFVLENCEDAVLSRHYPTPAQRQGAVACLFRWIWNEPEVPVMVTLAAWWLSILLALNGRAPVGAPAGPLGKHDVALLQRAEAKALKRIAALYATLVGHYDSCCFVAVTVVR
jgi:hypothetical protein